MTDLTTTDDWLTTTCVWERDRIRHTFRVRHDIVSRWLPRVCPPHPVACPAGGTHVWMRDSDDRGSWCACDECGAPCDGPFYPEEGGET